ncbi:MAG: ABC transporter substrate-binding protein [Helicobacteraceae bacterium]|jgi:ABC-type nitrate/sulfonate/bicarbonate transport system substrate-binding protein|nr:ABC transporter substrate-binding protein [Helicobacteraceae bacterium]
MAKIAGFKKIAATLAAFGFISANAAEPTLKEINLQKSPWTVIAAEKGFFKEYFDPIGTKKINLIAQGAAELLGAESASVGGGSLAVAQRMIYPATAQKANGLDAVIVWISEPSNRYRTPILIRADNDKIKTVKDLEGKKFGSSRISCYWSAPFEILNNAGIPFDSRLKKGRVRHENIDNSSIAISAVLTGDTDATAAHLAAPAFTGPWLSGKFKVLERPADDSVYVNNAGRVTYFARRDFAEKYPSVIKAFLAAREKTREWAFDHPNEAAAIVSKETRVPLEVALFQITHLGQWEFMGGEANADRAREALRKFQSYYVANGDDILVDRKLTDAQIDKFIDGRFFVGGSHSIYK